MKSTLPLLALSLFFASCTTAYKSGQTPDDVYFSPTRPQDEYVRQEKKHEDREYRTDEAYRDDRYLRMKIRDRRYVDLYDDYYSYNPYYYHYYNGYLEYNSPWNSYSYWNYYYNPYCHQVIAVTPRAPLYHHARTFDLGVYQAPSSASSGRVPHGYSGTPYSNGNNRNNNAGNYQNSGSNAGNFLRNAFSGNNNSSSSGSNNNSSNGGRTGSSSSSSSSGSSSSGSSTNAPARRF